MVSSKSGYPTSSANKYFSPRKKESSLSEILGAYKKEVESGKSRKVLFLKFNFQSKKINCNCSKSLIVIYIGHPDVFQSPDDLINILIDGSKRNFFSVLPTI
jgi:hypothetical protein